jgi:hypothetical protein
MNSLLIALPLLSALGGGSLSTLGPDSEGRFDQLSVTWTQDDLPRSAALRLWRVRDPYMEVVEWSLETTEEFESLLTSCATEEGPAQPVQAAARLQELLQPFYEADPLVVHRTDGFRWCTWRIKNVDTLGTGWSGWSQSSHNWLDYLDFTAVAAGFLPSGEWTSYAANKGNLSDVRVEEGVHAANMLALVEDSRMHAGGAWEFDSQGFLLSFGHGGPVERTEDAFLGLGAGEFLHHPENWSVHQRQWGPMRTGHTNPSVLSKAMPIGGEIRELKALPQRFVALPVPPGMEPFETGTSLETAPTWGGYSKVTYSHEPFFTAPEFLGGQERVEEIRAAGQAGMTPPIPQRIWWGAGLGAALLLFGMRMMRRAPAVEASRAGRLHSVLLPTLLVLGVGGVVVLRYWGEHHEPSGMQAKQELHGMESPAPAGAHSLEVARSKGRSARTSASREEEEPSEGSPPAGPESSLLELHFERGGIPAEAGLAALVIPVGGAEHSLQSDELGYAVSGPLHPGPCRVIGPGGQVHELTLAAGATESLRLKLESAFAVEGIVIGPNGERVRNARVVRNVYFGPELGWRGRGAVACDEEGRFLLTNVSTNDSLHGTASGYANSFRVVFGSGHPGRRAQAELRLGLAGPGLEVLVRGPDSRVQAGLRVVLTAQGPSSGTAGEQMSLGSPPVVLVTDELGEALARDLAPGTYSVQISAGPSWCTYRDQLTLEPDRAHTLEIDLVPGQRVVGRVLNLDGSPAKGARVTLHRTHSKIAARMVTDERGGFASPALPRPAALVDHDHDSSIGGLLADLGRNTSFYRLVARGADGAMGMSQVDLRDFSEDSWVQVQLEQAPKPAALADPDGKPLIGWRVALESLTLPTDGGLVSCRPRFVYSAQRGTVDLGGIPAGRYRISVFNPSLSGLLAVAEFEEELPLSRLDTWVIPD